MSYTVEYYQSLVTSEHQSAPNYMAWLGSMVEPITVIQSVVQNFVNDFDVDTAIGVQLDQVGQWVGVSRILETPITGVFFTFDTDGLGFDQGIWQGPYDGNEITLMPDDIYRIVIKFKILANRWDGTIPTAYADFATVFTNGEYVFIIDNQDMSMSIGLVGFDIGAIGQAVLQQGYFPFKPEGVLIRDYIIVPTGQKIFAFDVSNDLLGGFDDGYFAQFITPT